MDRNTESKINFTSVVMGAEGTNRKCNDGSGFDDFLICSDSQFIDTLVDNLDTWFSEEYEGIECTLENARDFFNEIYPEVL